MKTRISKTIHSKRPSSKKLPIEGPFDPKIWSKAESIARQYRVVIETDKKLGYVAKAIEMPTVFGDGKDQMTCLERTLEALTVTVASLIEAGIEPPSPAREKKRQEQMNVRLDPEEKLILKEAAHQRGYRSISDYVRAVSLRDARQPA